METQNAEPVIKKNRKFLPVNFILRTWEDILPFYEDLLGRPLDSMKSQMSWLADRSELESFIQEDFAWRYIRQSCETNNKQFSDSYNYFVMEIEPKISPNNNKLNVKLLASPYLKELSEGDYKNYIRNVKTQVEIYRDENIPLFAEMQQKEQDYSTIAGAMSLVVDGEEMTLQQASNILKDPDREKRKDIFLRIAEERQKYASKLDLLFDELISIRNKIALNAGFDNYRDYMFSAMGRFDYSAEDCFNLHQSIAREVVPVCDKLDRERKEELGYDVLRPYDVDVDPGGNIALKPFSNGTDLMDKTIRCFNEIDPFLGSCMEMLRDLKQVDLESRLGKAPGGYNYPLYETGVPFVFMNSANSLRDLVTIVHEGGHAVHSIVTRDLEYVDFKSCPSEVAELASMSMELISMEHWHIFFDNPEELIRAKRQHLEKLIAALPWIATVDKFQHWIYTNPYHSAGERKNKWMEIYRQFAGSVFDWTGYEEIMANLWQRQLHLYQVPFYYIEYAMAQLGAIAVWRNYKNNPQTALRQYIDALKLGYTRSIGRIYETAGVRFDFSQDYIRELCVFVQKELDALG
jgi:oligoendopeptidase F